MDERRVAEALDVIKAALEELKELYVAVGSVREEKLTHVNERLGRWKERTVRHLAEAVSPVEAENLRRTQGPIRLGQFAMNIESAISTYANFLTALREDLKKHPKDTLKPAAPVPATAAASAPTRDAPLDRLDKLLGRFHKVAVQLRKRRGEAPALEMENEHDVQYLLGALLRIEFDDVRPEERTPSYAGGSSRMDFLLWTEKVVVETKMTRPTLTEVALRKELLDDIAWYGEHPRCKTLVCFIYDPGNRLANPTGFTGDLQRTPAGDLTVKVRTYPTP